MVLELDAFLPRLPQAVAENHHHPPPRFMYTPRGYMELLRMPHAAELQSFRGTTSPLAFSHSGVRVASLRLQASGLGNRESLSLTYAWIRRRQIPPTREKKWLQRGKPTTSALRCC